MSILELFKLANSACGTRTGFLPSLYDRMSCSADGGVQISSAQDIWILVANMIRILIVAAGALTVIFIIVGGIWYVTSLGDPVRLKRAKEIVNYSVMGLILTVAAYGVVLFIANSF